MPKFRTSRGRLTAYSFHCGYTEVKRDGDIETTMWHEGIVYHVRQFDHGPKTWGRKFWKTFETLTEARRCFNAAPGTIN